MNLPNLLSTQTVLTQFQSTSYSASSNGFQIPAPTVVLGKPLSYQFRVAEYVDEEGNVKKVGLQVSVHEHDHYGSAQLKQDWTDVERVKIKLAT